MQKAEYGNYGTRRVVELLEILSAETLPAGTTLADVQESARQALATFTAHYQPIGQRSDERCPECGTRQRYQGWRNYETWEVALELSNDEGSNDTCLEIVEEAGSVAAGADALKDYWEAWIDEAVSQYSLVNRSYAGSASSKVTSFSVDKLPFNSLYNAALSEIDWVEVARSFKPDSWGDADEAPAETDDDELPDNDATWDALGFDSIHFDDKSAE